MTKRDRIMLFAVFIGASIFFLILERLTHFEFLLHAAAIPLEVMTAVLIVERFLEKRESRAKRDRLMLIKSHMFRTEMRNLFLADFAALASPAVGMEDIRTASLEKLKEFRHAAETVSYASPEAMEPVIMEYVKAEPVWRSFLSWSVTFNFDEIFHDMIDLLHFTSDVRIFKDTHPGKLFVHEAARRPELMTRTHRIIGDGIRRFLDYAIELKEKQPEMFGEMMADYALSARLGGNHG